MQDNTEKNVTRDEPEKRSGIVTISYTEWGSRLQKRLAPVLYRIAPEEEVLHYAFRPGAEICAGADAAALQLFSRTGEILDRFFGHARLLIFISAAGIAVRKTAPYLQGKTKDPAVLCLDEQGHYVIPLLSGHLGGANAWARSIARELGAEAVITTATDGRGMFAADLFAKENHLLIMDIKKIREISAWLLDGGTVGLVCGREIDGELPDGLQWFQKNTDPAGTLRPGCGITVTSDAGLPCQFEVECRLVPQNLCLGIGCRRGVDKQTLYDFVRAALKTAGLYPQALCSIASIDIKKEEPGIVGLAEQLGLPFNVYTAQRLQELPGEYTGSEFVREQTGVDNVCERSAMCAAGEGARLVLRKTAGNGMTLAVAEAKTGLSFFKAGAERI